MLFSLLSLVSALSHTVAGGEPGGCEERRKKSVRQRTARSSAMRRALAIPSVMSAYPVCTRVRMKGIEIDGGSMKAEEHKTERRALRGDQWDRTWIPCDRHPERRCNRSLYAARGTRRCGSCKNRRVDGTRIPSHIRYDSSEQRRWRTLSTRRWHKIQEYKW